MFYEDDELIDYRDLNLTQKILKIILNVAKIIKKLDHIIFYHKLFWSRPTSE